MTCRECGCTDERACVREGIACWWAEPDLCVFCLFDLPGDGQVPVRGVDDIRSIGGIL